MKLEKVKERKKERKGKKIIRLLLPFKDKMTKGRSEASNMPINKRSKIESKMSGELRNSTVQYLILNLTLTLDQRHQLDWYQPRTLHILKYEIRKERWMWRKDFSRASEK